MPKKDWKTHPSYHPQPSYSTVWAPEQQQLSGFMPPISMDCNTYCFCRICQQSFFGEIYIHYANTHFLLVCNPCNTCFPNVNEYRAHACRAASNFTQHENISSVNCYNCNYQTSSYVQWEDHCKEHMLQCWRCHSSFTTQTEFLNHQYLCTGHAIESTSSSTHVPRAVTLENMLFEKRKRDNSEMVGSVDKRQKWQHGSQRQISQPLMVKQFESNKLQNRIGSSESLEQKSADHVKWLPRGSRASSRSTSSIQDGESMDTSNASPTSKITTLKSSDRIANTRMESEQEQVDKSLQTQIKGKLERMPAREDDSLVQTQKVETENHVSTSSTTPVIRRPKKYPQSEPVKRTTRLMASVQRLQASACKPPRSDSDTSFPVPNTNGLTVRAKIPTTVLNPEEESQDQDGPSDEEASFSSETTLTSSEAIVPDTSKSLPLVFPSREETIDTSNIMDDLAVVKVCRPANKSEIVIRSITDSAVGSEVVIHEQEIGHHITIESQDVVTQGGKVIPIVSDIESAVITVQTVASQDPSSSVLKSGDNQPLPSSIDRKRITCQMILEMEARIEELESNQKLLLQDHDLRKCQERIMKLEAIIASKNVIIHSNEARLRALEKEYFNIVVKNATEQAHQILTREQVSHQSSARDISFDETYTQTHHTDHTVSKDTIIDTLGVNVSEYTEWIKTLRNEHFSMPN